MAGYSFYDEGSGEVVNAMYEYPFVVRGLPRIGEVDSIASFKTQAQADEWLKQHEADYKAGPHGHVRLWVENWNE